MPFSVYVADAVLNYLYRGVAMPSIPGRYLGLLTVLPAGGGPGTEVSLAGYARKNVGAAVNMPVNGDMVNTAALGSFTVSSGTVSVVGVAMYDASSGGNQL